MLIFPDGGENRIKIGAPAKINLGLNILGKRPDGFHEIWTIMQTIGLKDTVVLQEAPGLSFSLQTDLPGIPNDEDNLCVKAARLIQQETCCNRGVSITLHKVIPAGAGLGGGSSDAAAVLIGLNRLWELSLSRQKLLELAARLGSDIPFFILGGGCIATGRGEQLAPVEGPLNDPIILICPQETISTSWAYKNLKNYHLTSNRESIIFHGSLRELKDLCAQNVLSNDFELLVFAHYPALKDIKETLLAEGAYFASLSGSGSAIFGIFETANSAIEASKRIATDGRLFVLHRDSAADKAAEF